MGPESVGLVEVRSRDSAEVTQVGVPLPGSNQSPSRTNPRGFEHDVHQKRDIDTGIFSSFLATMAFWKSEKQKATMAVDYTPVGQDAEDDEHGGTRVTYTTTRPQMRTPRSWQLYLLGLAAV